MAPVDELIERPLGRLGETVNVTGDVPPVDVTGVELVAAIPAVSVSDAIASVVVRAAETASAKDFELVAPLASVAVTV
jgi:hypothetical protein